MITLLDELIVVPRALMVHLLNGTMFDHLYDGYSSTQSFFQV